MKKSLLLGICILFTFSVAIAQQKIKDGTITGAALPNKDALLELESANKGLLHARVALVQTTNFAPLTAHVSGMMVYNTATANDVVPGIYYNDGTKWISARGANGIIKVVKQPGKTGTPGLPGSIGGPGLGTNVVINDTGTYIFDADTNTYTLINAKGDKGDAGVVGVQGLPGTGGTPGTPGSGTPGAPGAGITIVNNDSGTYVYNPTTNTYTRINGPKGDTGAAGVVGVQGLPGTGGTPGIPGSGTPGAPGAGITIVNNDSGTYVYNPTTNTYTRINGPKGDKGDAGIVGVQGLPGTGGTPGTPGSGTPGAPGAGITIVNNDSGTYVYNPTTNTYTRINGPKGDKGDVGATGAKGDKGDVGLTGSVGATGAVGPIGLTGAIGATGAKGDKGDVGLNGSVGATGAVGPIGLTGAIGVTGAKGDKGDVGLTGSVGATGAVGPIGLTGAIGATGAVGPIGPIGLTGAAGISGIGGATTAGTGISITGTGSILNPYIINNTVVNTDNQTITNFALDAATNVLTLTLERGNTKTVDLSSLSNATSTNGLTKTGVNTQLGGDLIKATIIGTDVNNTLTISGLQPGTIADSLVVRDGAGVLKFIPATAFLPLFTADNGLTENVPGNTQLGGKLIRSTIIETDPLNGSTLAITNLQNGAGIDRTLVVDVNGVLKTVAPLNTSVTSLVKITANYTTLATDYTILANATGGAFVITLPAATANLGRILVIRKTDETGNLLTFSLPIKISETTSFTTTNLNGTIRIQSDGVSWYRID